MSFGTGDESLRAAGGDAGVSALVERFYEYMDRVAEATTIRQMHSGSLDKSKDKLKVFLVGWLGGPKDYKTRFGSIRIPEAHRHLEIGEAERDAWLLCMEKAAFDQEHWSDEFRDYFLHQISVPAERVLSISRRRLL